MIDALINRIKDAYFDLERDGARRERFYTQTQAFTPGAIVPSPGQMMQNPQQLSPEAQQPDLGSQLPNPGMPQPAPEPSILDRLAAGR